MNHKRIAASVFIGLSMAVLGLAGCEQRMTSPKQIDIEPDKIVPADHLIVNVVWPSSPASAKVTLSQGSYTVGDTTLTNPSGTTSITFSGLAAGTYQVYVSAPGFTAQGGFVSIVTAIVPKITMTMRAIATSPTIEFKEEVITDPNIVTTVTLPPPTAVTDITASAPPTTVAIQNVTGAVTVVATTQAEVPPVVSSTGTVTSSVISAVQIQVPAEDADASVTVSLPLPIESTEFASAAGGSVDILSFDFATATWKTIGQATIAADGTVPYSVTGLKTDNVIAVGVPPAISSADQLISTVQTITPTQVDAIRSTGATELEYNLNATVDFTSSKPAAEETPFARPAVREPPPGVPLNYWAQAVPFIAKQEPALHDWIYNDLLTNAVDISGTGTRTVEITKRTLTFTFTYKYGGVSKRFTLKITFNKGDVFIEHDSGVVIGG